MALFCVLASALITSAARAETRLVLRSTTSIHIAEEEDDCPVPDEELEVRAEVVFERVGTKYRGVGTVRHVRHEPVPSFECDDTACNLVSQQETDGQFWAELEIDCNGVVALSVTPLYLPPFLSSGWSYSCPGMVQTGPAWASYFMDFHYAETIEGPLGAPVVRMTGFTSSGSGLFEKHYSASDYPFSEETTVQIFHEPIDVTAVSPQWQQTFLQGISYPNEITATIDWKQPGGQRAVTFVLNGREYPVPNPGSATVTQERHTFDVGTEYQLGKNTLIVRAQLNNECGDSRALTPEHAQRVVPDWAANAGITAADGVLYSGVVPWPDDLDVDHDITEAPLVNGIWGLFGGAPEVGAKAISTGARVPGTVGGSVTIGLGPIPLATPALTGTTSGWLTDALHLTGNMSMQLGRLTKSKTVSLLDLVPGASAACAAVPLLGEVCGALRGLAGITGEVGGDARLQGDFADRGDELAFTDGSVRLGLDAQVFVGAALPWPLDLAGFRVSGGGRGCVNFTLDPIAYQSHGGQLDFSALAYVPGASRSFAKSWPFGTGCGAAAAFYRIPSPADAVAVSAMAHDARPRLALGASGRMALAWSEPVGASERPSAEIFLALHDGSAWGSAIRLTDDALLDQRPSVAFGANGRVLVVWEHQPAASFPEFGAGVSAFAAGFELAYAAVDPAGAVIDRGRLTDNAAFDFGPALCRVGDSVRLVWQRTSGTTLVGTSASPASLHARSWDGASFTPSEVDVSGAVTGLFGWELACHAQAGVLIAATRDLDANLVTESDREIFLFRDRGAGFLPVQRVTEDGVADHAVHATFAPDGTPVLAWLREAAVAGTSGEPLAPIQTWIPASAQVGPGFARARVGASRDTLLVVWPGAKDIEYAAAAFPGTTGLSAPAALATLPDLESDLELVLTPGGDLALGALSTPVLEGVPPVLAARGVYSVMPSALAPDAGSGGSDAGAGHGDAGADAAATGGEPSTDAGSGAAEAGANAADAQVADAAAEAAEASRGTDAGEEDGASGATSRDARADQSPQDDESDGSVSDDPSDASDGGCGCRTVPSRGKAWPALLGVLLLATAFRLRRRARG